MMGGGSGKRVGSRAGPLAPVETNMAKSQQKSNKEIRKPKAEKVKTNASNPTAKGDPVKMVNIKG
jgi:hypothetical protein